MEKKENPWVLNPETNRFIKRGTALHRRLIKAGKVNEDAEYQKPALVVEKKVKAVANIKDMNKTEVEDIYQQIKAWKLQQEKKERKGRPIGTKVDPEKPTVKGSMGLSKPLPTLKPIVKKEPLFKVSVKPTKAKTETEFDFTDED